MRRSLVTSSKARRSDGGRSGTNYPATARSPAPRRRFSSRGQGRRVSRFRRHCQTGPSPRSRPSHYGCAFSKSRRPPGDEISRQRTRKRCANQAASRVASGKEQASWRPHQCDTGPIARENRRRRVGRASALAKCTAGPGRDFAARGDLLHRAMHIASKPGRWE